MFAIVSNVSKDLLVLGHQQFKPAVDHHVVFLTNPNQLLIKAENGIRIADLCLRVDDRVIRIDRHPRLAMREARVLLRCPLHRRARVVTPLAADVSHSDAMFSTLIDYKQEAYYAEHSVITLDSIYGRRSYRIFAVLNMKVSDWDPAAASFGNGKAFLQFVNRAKRKALFNTGVEVKENDHILTLITCDRSYSGASGRLIVMAVQE